jgi:hypothetical protein
MKSELKIKGDAFVNECGLAAKLLIRNSDLHEVNLL